ncbi:NUDIX hydrolase [Nigerium massiliense]|uniref:NUDIX hydrolase n=1 Tax=Nigerium massiliense TaxID=1522317 RepID=UPI000694CCC2|nr:NUDIX hydrolase [Nigerium massiliense]
MSGRVEVQLQVQGPAGILTWDGSPDPAALASVLPRAVDDAFAQGVHRLTVSVPAADGETRRVLHRAGFRFEGLARHEDELPDGAWADRAHYALLASDATEGRERFTSVMSAVLPRKRLIAHVLLLDGAGRVALCETTFKPDYELPGGIVEPLESPRDGVLREMIEELGVAFEPDRVLLIDWLRPYLGWEDALELVFGCPVLSEDDKERIRPDGLEIRAVHWLSPEEAAPTMTDFGARRLFSALAAHERGVTAYSEAGVTIAAPGD